MTSVFRTPAQAVLTGPGSLAQLPAELDALGATRPFLLAGVRGGAGLAAQRVREVLGDRIAGEYARMRAAAPEEDVDAAAAAALGADALVAVGGGSVSDAAKAVAARLPRRPHLVAVPTTLSGAELTGVGVVSADGRKRHFLAPGETVFAAVVVYDPEAIADVPAEVLRTTGMNGLAHCVEGYYSRNASPASDALALRGALLFVQGLRSLAPETMQAAAVLGGLTLHHARAGVHHAICHAVFDAVGAPHGFSNSAVLPYALAFNLEASEAQQAELAAALAPDLGAGPLREQIARLQHELDVPASLAALGVERGQLSEIADGAFARSPPTNPRLGWTAADLLPTLESAWQGRPTG